MKSKAKNACKRYENNSRDNSTVSLISVNKSLKESMTFRNGCFFR